MREIKFRALDEFSDQWIYGQAFFVDSDNNQGYIANGISDHHCVRKETAGQYTGLKDRNGKEIYEGDICNVALSTGENVRANVVFVDGCFELHFIKLVEINIRHGCRDYLKCYVVNHAVEIIGNKFQNPELLQN